MPSRKELVAHGRDNGEIAAAIGADVVIFQTLPDLIDSVRQLRPAITDFDCSVFTGQYITGGVDEEYLQHVESLRADNTRLKALNLDLGTVEGKGNGGVDGSEPEVKTGASTPVNGSDDTVGLHNSWNTHS
jgi:amidophosphoribosyltransferase